MSILTYIPIHLGHWKNSGKTSKEKGGAITVCIAGKPLRGAAPRTGYSLQVEEGKYGRRALRDPLENLDRGHRRQCRFRTRQAAARELKMSYRALWGRIKASEERLGKILVEREGRGSKLTPFARQLMDRFRQLQSQIRQQSDQVFENLMADSL